MDHLASVFRDQEIRAVPPIRYHRVLDGCKNHGSDFIDFIEFPMAHGWQVNEDYTLTDVEHENSDDLCQQLDGYHFLQAWIYFQLLRSFLGTDPNPPISFREDDFTSDDSKELRSMALREALEHWKRYIEALYRVDVDMAVRKLLQANQMIELGRRVITANLTNKALPISNAIGLSLTDLSTLQGNIKSRSDCFRRLPKVEEAEEGLCLMVLGETLSSALTWVVNNLQLDLSGWQSEEDAGWGPHDFNRKGWCPRSLNTWKGTLGRSAILLNATLRSQKSNPHMKHSDASCGADNCSFIEAARNPAASAQYSQYEPMHREPECSCRGLVGPDENDIIRVLSADSENEKEGDFPLLSVRTLNDAMVVDVKSWEQGDRFATISHVWSQGLGNSSENKIQSCQLTAILEYLNALFGDSPEKPHLFWLDTLAIPQNIDDDGTTEEQYNLTRAQLKKRAINRINHVFAKATHCIIIDRHLVTNGRSLNDSRTTAIGLLASAWITRLWTLQEAFVSGHCYVAVSQSPGLLWSVDDFWERISEDEDHFMSVSLGQVIWRKLAENMMRKTSPEIWAGGSRKRAWFLITNAWRATRFRRKEDETQVLASLLNIPIPQAPADLTNSTESGILQSDATRRQDELMCDFWKIVSQHEHVSRAIPAGIIFSPGHRLPIPGYGWAPRSWMCREDESYPYPLRSPDYGSLCEGKGLKVRYPGFLLYPSNGMLKKILGISTETSFDFCADREVSERYYVRRVGEDSQLSTQSGRDNIDNNQHIPDRLGHILSEMGRLQTAIILSRPRPVGTPGEIGLLVEVTSPKHTQKSGEKWHVNSKKEDDRSFHSDDELAEPKQDSTHRTLDCKIICRIEISRFHTGYHQRDAMRSTLIERFGKFGKDEIAGVHVPSTQYWCVDGHTGVHEPEFQPLDLYINDTLLTEGQDSRLSVDIGKSFEQEIVDDNNEVERGEGESAESNDDEAQEGARPTNEGDGSSSEVTSFSGNLPLSEGFQEPQKPKVRDKVRKRMEVLKTKVRSFFKQ